MLKALKNFSAIEMSAFCTKFILDGEAQMSAVVFQERVEVLFGVLKKRDQEKMIDIGVPH